MSAAPATPTVLATIVQLDPIYVNFNISEQDVIRVRAALAKRGVTREDVMKYPRSRSHCRTRPTIRSRADRLCRADA